MCRPAWRRLLMSWDFRIRLISAVCSSGMWGCRRRRFGGRVWRGEGVLLTAAWGVLFRRSSSGIETSISSINPSPGVARQLLTFLASPRKVSKRRRPLGRSPLRGFPAPAGTNREGKTTRYAQTFFPSFSDLTLPSPATLKRTSRRARFASPGDGDYANSFSLFCFVVPTKVGTQRREDG